MPLLFAIAGVVALGLSFVVLVGPVLLAVAMFRVVRSTRLGRSPSPRSQPAVASSPVAEPLADTVFAALITREWPAEAAVLRDRST